MAACSVCDWRLKNVSANASRPAAVASRAWSNANWPAADSTPRSVTRAVPDWPKASVASTVNTLLPASIRTSAKKLPPASNASAGRPLIVTATIGAISTPGVARPTSTAYEPARNSLPGTGSLTTTAGGGAVQVTTAVSDHVPDEAVTVSTPGRTPVSVNTARPRPSVTAKPLVACGPATAKSTRTPGSGCHAASVSVATNTCWLPTCWLAASGVNSKCVMALIRPNAWPPK